MGRLVYLAQMSAVCANDLHELCQDASCEDYCHDTEDLEPLDLDDAGDDATMLHAEARFEARRDD